MKTKNNMGTTGNRTIKPTAVNNQYQMLGLMCSFCDRSCGQMEVAVPYCLHISQSTQIRHSMRLSEH